MGNEVWSSVRMRPICEQNVEPAPAALFLFGVPAALEYGTQRRLHACDNCAEKGPLDWSGAGAGPLHNQRSNLIAGLTSGLRSSAWESRSRTGEALAMPSGDRLRSYGDQHPVPILPTPGQPPRSDRTVTLIVKYTGTRNAGNAHAGCDVAGLETGLSCGSPRLVFDPAGL